METRKAVVWIGAATLLAAGVVNAMWSTEEVTEKPVAAPDLFSFVIPMESIAPVDVTVPPSADASDQTAVAHIETGYEKMHNVAQAQNNPLTPANVLSTEQSVQQMRIQGAGEDDVYRVRAAALSAEMAARLMEMDRAETAWKSRINAYLAERSMVLNSTGVDQFAVLQQLRDARFTADEQVRLAAYEPSGAPLLTLP